MKIDDIMKSEALKDLFLDGLNEKDTVAVSIMEEINKAVFSCSKIEMDMKGRGELTIAIRDDFERIRLALIEAYNALDSVVNEVIIKP